MMSEKKQEEDADNEDTSLKKYLIIVGLVSGLPIIIAFVIGLILAITGEPENVVKHVSAFRDVTIIVVFFELFLIIVVTVGLVIQITRLIGTVQGELQPMIVNTRETTETVKGTTKFVSRNLVEPIISFWIILAGIMTVLREVGGIRRAIRKQKTDKE